MVRYYVLFLVLSLYLSITLLEGLVILGILYALWNWFKSKKLQGGKLSIPIFLYAFPTLLSTLLYYTKRFDKAIEEGLFQFIYFLNLSKDEIRFLLSQIPKIFLFGFFLLLPFELYSYHKFGETKPIWGGTFETGFFYTLSGLTFFLVSFFQERKLKILFLLGAFASFFVVIFSHRRSMILAYVVLFILILYVLYRSKIIRKAVFLGILVLFLSVGVLGYAYLSKTDYRFKTFNEVILGYRELNEQTLNVISSERYTLFKEGLEVLKEDIKNKRYLPLLIGHGVRAKEYLTPKSPIVQPRYESFFVFSEFIERGVVGLIGILLIYAIYFKELFSFRIREKLDAYRLVIILPLGIHLIQAIFTYFWDAMFPVFLLLFKIYEVSKEHKS